MVFGSQLVPLGGPAGPKERIRSCKDTLSCQQVLKAHPFSSASAFKSVKIHPLVSAGPESTTSPVSLCHQVSCKGRQPDSGVKLIAALRITLPYHSRVQDTPFQKGRVNVLAGRWSHFRPEQARHEVGITLSWYTYCFETMRFKNPHLG